MGSAQALLDLAGRFVHKDVVVARDLAADLGIDLGTLEPVTDRVLDRTAPRRRADANRLMGRHR